jgi:hypothetical protein
MLLREKRESAVAPERHPDADFPKYARSAHF